MLNRIRLSTPLRAAFLGALLFISATSAHAEKWRPVDPAELADETPQVDPEAGAEILFCDVNVDQRDPEQHISESYVRIKIYNARGVDDLALIKIHFGNDYALREIQARTIKPDGEIIELSSKDFYTRNVRKEGNEIERETSFAPAGLQPGAIVEYRYFTTTYKWRYYIPLFFQQWLPAREVHVRVVPSATHRVNALNFNMARQNMKPHPDGSFHFELKNVPKKNDEPWQPPELNAQSAILLCYSPDNRAQPGDFWQDYAERLEEAFTFDVAPSRLVKKTLAEITGKADSDDQKLRKIYDYCRSQILNTERDTTHLTREQRASRKDEVEPGDTIKTGFGNSDEINCLFIAFATAAGFEAHVAVVNDRSFINFRRDTNEYCMANDLIAAVEINGHWRFFDPGATYLPFATLRPRNSGTAALVASLKKSDFIPTPGQTAEFSQTHSLGVFTLDAEGTLEGDVTIEYTGYRDAETKYELDALSPVEREKKLREDLQKTLKLAELTELKIENAADPLKETKVAYHLRIPEYADRTGSRLFFSPAVFYKNEPAVFTQATRKEDIYFPHRSKTIDEIRITPPEGFEFEEPSAPGSLNLGDMGAYQTTIGLNRKTGALVYRRIFTLRALALSKDSYASVRDAFEIIHQRDGHTLTLRKKEITASSASSANATHTSSAAPDAAAHE